ncbi:MAG: hypothetical protein ACFB0B_11835 [Thermonemataceae bacterium]
MKKNTLLLLMVLSFVSQAFAQLPKEVKSTFDELYPKRGSLSYSLYEDFYEIGYDGLEGRYINVLIDKKGNYLGTHEIDEVDSDKKKEIISKVQPACDDPSVVIVNGPMDEILYLITCIIADEKSQTTTKILLSEELKVIKKGTEKVTYD